MLYKILCWMCSADAGNLGRFVMGVCSVFFIILVRSHLKFLREEKKEIRERMAELTKKNKDMAHINSCIQGR